MVNNCSVEAAWRASWKPQASHCVWYGIAMIRW